MDKALVFGTKDCRLESCQDHLRVLLSKVLANLFYVAYFAVKLAC